MDIIQKLSGLEQDALLWKAIRIWGEDPNPDDMVTAIEALTEMLICINNEIKRNEYTSLVQRELKIRDKLLDKSVKKAVTLKESKLKEAAQKAKLKNDSSTKDSHGIEEGAEGEIYDILKFSIYIKGGIYYKWLGNYKAEPISNFTMKIFYHADTGDDRAYRLIALKNEYGFEKTINMNTDDFSSVGSFKREIARRGNFSWRGNDADLARLAEMLQKDEITARSITTLGYQKRGGFWAWANGIVAIKDDGTPNEFIPVDDYGIVKLNEKSYFLEYCAEMNVGHEDKFINEKKFIHLENVNAISINEWMRLFKRSYGDKAMAGILFYLSSVFSDIVFNIVNRFPILSLIGPGGAGKGEMAESIMSLFGDGQKAIMLGGQTTATGFMRKFAQVRNSIIWLDEFKNNISPKIQESIKNLYDRTGYERGKKTNDYQTDSTPVFSSCLLSGQEMPGEAALFMRTIQLLFKKGNFTEKQRQEFGEFKDLERDGFSYITSEVFKYRSTVLKTFKINYESIKDQLFREAKGKGMDDRFVVNIAIILTFYVIFEKLFDFPFQFQEAKAWLLKNMLEQYKISKNDNEMGKFWGVVETLFHMELIAEGKDFMLEEGTIYLCLTTVHPLYVKEMRARGDTTYLQKGTLEIYLKEESSYWKEYKRKRFPNGSNPFCHLIEYNKLGIDLIRSKKDGLGTKSADERNKEMGVVIEEERPDNLPF